MGTMKSSYYLMMANADRIELIELAFSMGLRILRNWPFAIPKAEYSCNAEQALSFSADTLFFLKEAWLDEPVVFDYINSGYRQGTYSIRPKTNFASIEAYLPSERTCGEGVRAGSGSLVIRKEYVRGSSGEKVTNDEVVLVYRQIVQKIQENSRTVSISQQRYIVMRNCMSKIEDGTLLPSFEFQDQFFR